MAVAGDGTSALEFHSTDGGTSWTSGSLPWSVDVDDSVSCLDAANCEIAGRPEGGGRVAVARTSNAGSTWSVTRVPGSSLLSAGSPGRISCYSIARCYLAGFDTQPDTVFLRPQSNAQWQWLRTPSGPPPLSRVWCSTIGNTCFASFRGNPGVIESTNGGITWNDVTIPSIRSLFARACQLLI